MARRFSAGRPTGASAVPAGSAYAEMLAGATLPVSVRSVIVSTRTNNGGTISLARAYAIGTGAATGIATAIHHRIGATTSARLQVAWAQAPTGYASRLRDLVLPVATGQAVEMWTEADGPLLIEPNESLLLINQGSGAVASYADGALNVNVTWEEGHLSDR